MKCIFSKSILTKLLFSFLLFPLINFAQGDIPTFDNSTPFYKSDIMSSESLSYTYDQTETGIPNTVTINPISFINLSVNNDIGPFTIYKFTLKTKIIPFLSDGTLDSSSMYEQMFTVEFNPITGLNTLDQVFHKIENSYGVKVVIADYSTEYIDTGVTVNEVPENIVLNIGFKAIRFKILDQNNTPNIQDIGLNIDTNQYDLKWTEVEGAVEYDFEWTWYDSYGEVEASSITLTEQQFQRNSTRINTINNYYSIPNIYGKGFLVYRVRAVGRFEGIDEYIFNKYAKWSREGTDISTVADWENHYIIINEHDDNKNWQFQASYAEEGKKKEVVSYFDGTLRNRQTVTRINSDKNVIAGEVIYDTQGRPAIEVLPVPTGNNTLQFQSDFNLNSNNKKYSHLDFDWEQATSISCNIPASEMNASNGASKYYSPTNNSSSHFRDFIPNAKNYPFSQIEYTPDNTGRISRKSGVGITHQLNSGHEMKYIYAKPFQNELDRLFGYEVGYKNHYKKNAVIDPNGQGSVSYIDPQGRTIATALVADSPGQLKPLDDERPLVDKDGNILVHEKYTQNALDNQLFNSNQFTSFSINDALKTQFFKAVVAQGNAHTLNYKLDVNDVFIPECFGDINTFDGKGYPFIFDLSLDALTDCGDSLLSNPINDSIQNNYNVINKTISIIDSYIPNPNEDPNIDGDEFTQVMVDFNYDDVTLQSIPTSSQNLFDNSFTTNPAPPVGDLQVFKLLKINKVAADKFAEDWVIKVQQNQDPNVKCILDLSDFNIQASFEDCYTSCYECVESITGAYGILDNDNNQVLDLDDSAYQSFLNTQQDVYVATQMLEYEETLDELGTPGEEDYDLVYNALFERFEREYLLLVEACTAECQSSYSNNSEDASDTVSCQVYDNIISSDLEWNGQYGAVYSQENTQGDNVLADAPAILNIYSENNLLTNNYNQNLYVSPSSPNPLPDNGFSWRTPFNTNYINDPYHYFNELGEIVRVSLELDANGNALDILVNNVLVSPVTVDNNSLIIPDPLNPGYGLIEPQFLKDAIIYKHFYDISWAKSLMIYHPEYCYLDFYNQLCDLTKNYTTTYWPNINSPVSGVYLNPDGYDAYLQQLDYTSATNYITGTLALDNIIADDPLFQELDSNLYSQLGFSNGLKHYNVMQNAVNNYNNSPLSLLDVTYKQIKCNNLSICNENFSQAGYDALVADKKEAFWNIYKNTYLSLRDKIKSAMANAYAIHNNCYNGCIGDTPSGNPDLGLTMYGFPNLTNSGNVCANNSGAYYNKVKRIVSEDALYNSNNTVAQTGQDLEELTDYENLTQSGQCPMERDFELFITNLFQDSNTENIPGFGEFSYEGNYISYGLWEDLGGLPIIDLDQAGNFVSTGVNYNSIDFVSNNTTSVLDVVITTDAPNSTLAPIKLNLVNSNLDWNDYNTSWIISEVSEFQYTSYNSSVNPIEFNFLMSAKIVHPSNPHILLEEVVVSGSTIARIGECFIDGQIDIATLDDGTPVGEDLGDGGELNEIECEDKDFFLISIKSLLNDLKNEGVLLSNTAIQLNESNYSNSYGNGFLANLLNDADMTASWKYYNNTKIGHIIENDGTILFSISFDDNLITSINNGTFQLFNHALFLNNDLSNISLIYYKFNGNIIFPFTISITSSQVTVLDYNCCGYITGNDSIDNADCGNLDSDGDGIGDLCDEDTNECGDIDSDGDGIGDLCDDPNANCNLDCNTAFVELLNYLISKDKLHSSYYNISSSLSFYKTCLDEFYDVSITDVLTWQFDNTWGNHTYTLKLNNIVIAEFITGITNLPVIEIQEFVTIQFNQPYLPSNMWYYGDFVIVNALNQSYTFSHFRSIFQCDMDNLCDNPSNRDSDHDGISDGCDNCLKAYNPNQDDSDGDGIGDACDTCPTKINIGDSDGDGIDDTCDTDITSPECIAEIQSNSDTFNQGITNLFNSRITSGSFYQTSYNVPIFLLGDNYNFLNVNAQILLNNNAYTLDNNFGWFYETNQLGFTNHIMLAFTGYQVFIELPENFMYNQVSSIVEIYPNGTPNNTLPESYTIRYTLNNDSTILTSFVTVKHSEKGGDLFPLNFDCNLDEVLSSSERIANIKSNNSKVFIEEEKCLECIPQTITPVAWSETLYQTEFVDNLSQIIDYNLPDYYNWEYFLDRKYQLILEGYINYLEAFGANIDTNNPLSAISTEDAFFMSIADFGATALNYGYNDYQTVINAYVNSQWTGTEYLSINHENYKTWSDFVLDYLLEHPEICPPVMVPQNIEVNVQDNFTNCEEYTISINEAYGIDSYNAYIDRLKRKFKIEYTQAALNSVEESLTLKYSDKEYQYTLYYYDQAGNLTQTVPPEGVKRVEFQDLDPSGNQTSIYDTDRANNAGASDTPAPITALPNHRLQTQYKYNSLNQLIWQSTPDGGVTVFAYDDLGRIIASQNENQSQSKRFSYTIYDDLGRIHEAGEIDGGSYYHIDEDLGRLVNINTSLYVNTFDISGLNLFRREVTKTIYDTSTFIEASTFISDYNPFNSINRVAGVLYYDTINPSVITDFDNALFYNYDVHGNVKELVTYITELKRDNYETHLKRVQYDYDLISGNVKKVIYQPNREGQPVNPDLFIHAYQYDADNRITSVKTSKDGYIWEEDANYKYYEHGPLARVELGAKQVQGVDYAYTLQGWLKAVNGESLNTLNNDMGTDGTNNHKYFAKDAYGYSLNYFKEDYQPINASVTSNILKLTSNSSINNNTNNLYNGNIKTMVTALRDFDQKILTTQVNNYTYDQLNRITNMASIAVNDKPFNTLTTTNSYESSYKYDRNGNLEDLIRAVPEVSTLNQIDDFDNLNKIDDFKYHYKPGTNQLLSVIDSGTENNYTEDLDDNTLSAVLQEYNLNNTATHHYTYDNIGQLIEDKREHLKINWRVDGKVKEIYNTVKNSIIKFKYDGLGNRIGKEVTANSQSTPKQTIYSRDAQGNVLAVYDFEDNDIADIPDNLIFTNQTITTTNVELANTSITASNYVINAPGDVTFKAGETIILQPGFQANQGAKFLAQIVPKQNIKDFSLILKEHHIYGSSRLGIEQNNTPIVDISQDQITDISRTSNSTLEHETYTSLIGDKNYELSNHLGNVLSVVTDKKLIATDVKEEIIYEGFENFERDGNSVNLETYDDQLNCINFYNHTGTQIRFKGLEVNKTYNVFTILDLEAYHYAVDVIVEDEAGDVFYYATVTQSGEFNFTFTTNSTSEEYKIRFLKNNINNSSDAEEIFSLKKTFRLSVLHKTDNVVGFLPDVISYNDYYPFGMLLPNRHGSTDSYRYGFQGQEKDDEVKGEGNSLNYKFRMHDPRVGRFFAVDPMVHGYPWYSPYQFSGNTPIMSLELEGLEPIVQNGILVGYTIQPGIVGPTYIAEDINNPLTQFIYGYTLQESIEWTDIVKQNEAYYKKVGDWGNSDMYDIENPVWSDLNSEVDHEVNVFGKLSVDFTTKPLSSDYKFGGSYTNGQADPKDGSVRWSDGIADFFNNLDGMLIGNGEGWQPPGGVHFSNGEFTKESINEGPMRSSRNADWFDWNGSLDPLIAIGKGGKPGRGGLGSDGRTPTSYTFGDQAQNLAGGVSKAVNALNSPGSVNSAVIQNSVTIKVNKYIWSPVDSSKTTSSYLTIIRVDTIVPGSKADSITSRDIRNAVDSISKQQRLIEGMQKYRNEVKERHNK